MDTPPNRDEAREIEGCLRRAFASSAVGLALVDASGRFLDVNPAFCEITGYPAQELAARTLSSLTHPEDWPESLRLIRLLETGQSPGFTRENRYLRKDGQTVWARNSVSGVSGAGPRAGCLLVLAENITRRKHAEEALARSRERLALAGQAAKIGIWELDFDQRTGSCTEENLRLFGLDPKGAFPAYEEWLRLIHPEDRGEVLARLAAARRGEQDYEVRFRVVWSDGTVRVLLSKGQVFCDAQGRRSRMAGVNLDVTAMVQAEDQLRAGEERYRRLIETAYEGIWIVDREGRTTYVNQRMAGMLGYGEQEMLGRPLFDFVDPELRAQVEARLAKRRRGVTSQHETWLRHKDGSRIFAIICSNPIYDSAGCYDGALGMLSDITPRIRAEEALRQSELRFRIAAANASDVICEWDLPRDRTEIFGPVERLGLKPEDLPTDGASWLALIHPEDRGRLTEATRRHLESDDPFREEVRLVIRGDVRHWSVRGASLPDAQGKPCRRIFTITDITDRKRAEDALRLSEERFRIAAQNASDVIFEWEAATGRLTYLDPARDRPGIPRDDLPGSFEAWRRMLHPEDRERITGMIERCLQTGEPFFQTYAMRTRAGVRYFESRVSALRDAEGKPCRWIGAATDVTDRLRAQQELAALNRSLRQFTGQILLSQDGERRRIARELQDGTAQKLAAVSLSLTPLEGAAALSGSQAKALQESLALLRECLRDIRAMSYLLHPLLLDELGIARVLPGYVQGFSRRTGVRAACEIQPDFGRLPPDSEIALFRIVQESLAIVHRHSGSATVRIRLAKATGEVRLEIQDRGPGLPPGSVAERFGVGILGMQERMRQLGGGLEVDSGPEGATVRARLPVKPQFR